MSFGKSNAGSPKAIPSCLLYIKKPSHTSAEASLLQSGYSPAFPKVRSLYVSYGYSPAIILRLIPFMSPMATPLL